MRFLWPLLLLAATVAAQSDLPRVSEKARGLTRQDGFFSFYFDERAGKLWLEIGRWNQEFLYVDALQAGLGSNDVGLDRGKLGKTRIVRFERHGPKVMLVQSNVEFRAVSNDPEERRAVADSFAQSVLWGFKAEAADGDRVLVDATDFFLRDAHGVAATLRRERQGAFRVDPLRSALYAPQTKNFPRNSEVEALLTFVGDEPGEWVRSVTPTPDAITLRLHHSFIELPDGNYRPRAFHPGAGYFGVDFMDYATPIHEPIRKRFLARHRLRKGQTLIYYLDRGAPEPIRSALLDGARWWADAFAAAGFPDAFRVELLPEGADPMDVRYNVIQWVHRSTRGWSYGSTVMDPRTGEIIKGKVTLGSLRVRQDFLIAEAFLAPYEAGKPIPKAMEEMALARLRQLSAHEVGHTLGLTHNFASSPANRASVMDYPHPLIATSLDLKDAYATGIGDWDKAAIAYGYGDQDEALAQAQARGLQFIADADARAAGGAHPDAHLWDNGPNAVDELNRMMQVRARALERFGERNIRAGAPMATLEEALVPLYLSHRYQTEAAAKVLGGLRYTYAVRGDGQKPTQPVAPAEQRRALEALLATLTPQALLLPERLLTLIPPRPVGYARHRETFPNRTGVTFDPLTAAESAADLTLGLLLHPERAARLVEHHARNAQNPSLDQVIDRILAAVWKPQSAPGLAGQLEHRVATVALTHLLRLAANPNASPEARAIAAVKLRALPQRPAPPTLSRYAELQIRQWEQDPRSILIPAPAAAPPGQPIGDDWE